MGNLDLYTLENIFVTALEGGCNYWIEDFVPYVDAETEFERKSTESYGEACARCVIGGGYVEIWCDDEVIGSIDLKSLTKALNDNVKQAVAIFYEDFDADDVDIVMQIATMGEIVYG